MLRVKNNTIPEALWTKFQITEECKITFKATKFGISSRGPRLWNKHFDKFLKTITSALLFKARLKEYLVKLRNVTLFLRKSLTSSRSISLN